MPVGKESREKLCLVPPGKLKKCTNTDAVGHMEFDISKGKIRWTKEGKYKDYCLGVTEVSDYHEPHPRDVHFARAEYR